MAKLDDVAESLNVEIKSRSVPSQQKATGHKRRDWLVNDDESKGVYRPLNVKGSIDPFKKDLNINLDKLRGNPLKITQYIFELIKQTSMMITEKVTLLEMMKSLELSKDSARTALRFLLKNNLIKRVDFYAGKHGWSKYELKKSLFDELENAYQKGSIDPLILKGSNSSSSKDLKTTTTKVGEEWNFDIAPYARLGFTTSQIKQLASLGVISAPDVERSLIEFSHDLDNNALPPIKTTKINFLMGLMRAGHAYVSEGFKNEHEATIAEMARKKQREKEKVC